MSRPDACAALVTAAVAAAVLLRLPALALRPMHGDEAVHAWRLDELLRTGRYVYNPSEFHGPTLNYLTLPVAWLRGAADTRTLNEADLRLVPALFGVAAVGLVWLLRDGLGRAAAAVATLIAAVSPALVFYSRYYIQETLLSFFVLAAIAAGWRYFVTRRRTWALAAGACAGCAHATKETSIIAFGCLLGAAAIVTGFRLARHPAARPSIKSRGHIHPRLLVDISLAGMAAVFASVTLFSSLFTNPAGPLDSLRALAHYIARAAGQGDIAAHDKPWHYYLATLLYTHTGSGPVWSEALILTLAAMGSVAILWRLRAGHRPPPSPASLPAGGTAGPTATAAPAADLQLFLLAYTVWICLAYSFIPYKTPWCVVQMLQPLTLLAGIGAAALLDLRRARSWRVTVSSILLLLCAQLAGQAWRASRAYCTDRRNPYVYAHPVTDVVRVGEYVERVAACAPDGCDTLVEVCHPNPWPLPWYLRRLNRVGYWETPPQRPPAAIAIADENFAPALDARYGSGYQMSIYGLRPAERLLAYVRQDLYDRFAERVQAQQPAPAGGAAP